MAGTIITAALFALLLGVDQEDIPFPDQVLAFRTFGGGSSTPPWGGYTQSFGAWGGLQVTRGPGVLSHEANHNIGDENWGRHAPGRGAAGPDPNWPSSIHANLDQIYDDTIGWNYITNELTTFNFDFMSYCMGGGYIAGDPYPDSSSYPINWVSDYRWELLFD